MPQFKALNPGDPDQIFIVARAAEGSQITKDAVVQLDVSTNVDGVRVVQPNTGELWAVVGLAAQAINDGDLGLVQVAGYRVSSQVFQTDTSQATGTPLVPVAGAYRMASVATTTASNAAVTQQPIFAALAESIASSTASTVISAKVFLRGLL